MYSAFDAEHKIKTYYYFLSNIGKLVIVEFSYIVSVRSDASVLIKFIRNT